MDGQLKLKAASVLCIGAGGLGSPVGLYLAAAGVGRIGIVDFDVVDFSNLQRQIIHGTPDVRSPEARVGAGPAERGQPRGRDHTAPRSRCRRTMRWTSWRAMTSSSTARITSNSVSCERCVCLVWGSRTSTAASFASRGRPRSSKTMAHAIAAFTRNRHRRGSCRVAPRGECSVFCPG